MSINPLANRPRADACGFGNGLRRLSARDLPYNALSTARRQPGILMHVHPVLPWNLKLQQPQLPRSEPDGQPTESSQLTSTTLADFEGHGNNFSVTHGWSAFGGADHGWQDVGLERRAWTLSQAVSGSVGSQGAATNVSTLRVGADRSWRSQEHSADGGAACTWRIRSIAPLHCRGGLGCDACGDGTACSSG